MYVNNLLVTVHSIVLMRIGGQTKKMCRRKGELNY